MLKFAAITPHPPIIVKEILPADSIDKVESTIKAMEDLAGSFKKTKCETVIVISPHALMHENSFVINNAPKLSGSLADFGWLKEFEFKNDFDLLAQTKVELTKAQIDFQLAENRLDHGTLVPLYYLSQNQDFKVMVFSFSLQNLKTHYQYGQILAKVFKKQKTRIGVIASGDLSHRLSKDAPGGFSPQAKKFDQLLLEHLQNQQIQKLINLPPALIQEAGECGLRSIAILLGILNDQEWEFSQLSYQAPFGVGYLTGRIIL
ncbi:MAG: AmmeMemoRadiSam system protein B [Candidatus Moranbacteria bacterium]|nr:AmmeMemoRadiSam system protein B [Candidatus Moranbacteria bacterium]